MQDLKWGYEGDILVFDDIVLIDPTITIQRIQFDVRDNQWLLNLSFNSLGQSHERMYEVEHAQSFDVLTEQEIISMVENEFPEFTRK